MLRANTAAAHEEVDAMFASYDLSSRDDYGRFLCAHAEALAPVEAWLDAHDAQRIVVDWPARRRLPALADDLAQLGLALPPGGAAVTLTPSAGALAGALYVIEGSRLGGKLLARSVAAGLPTRYLQPGAGAPSWRALLAAVEPVLASRSARDEALAAALAVFARFAAAGRHWAMGAAA